jgi:hypothetical protein
MPMNAGGHLTSEDVAAYLDNTLPEQECARVKSHLADCDACRREVVSVSKLLAGAPRSRRRFATLSALAAAAVLVVFLARPSIDSRTAASDTLRGRDAALSEGVSGLRAISPIGRQTTAAGIVFAWHRGMPGAAYRFTLTDDRGGKVWVASTNDTTLALPQTTPLLTNQDYHWYVDVLEPDGSSTTTGILSFQVVR